MEAARERVSRVVRASTRGGYFFAAVAGAFGLSRLLEVAYDGFAPEHYAVGATLAACTAAGLRGVPGRRVRSAAVLSVVGASAGMSLGFAKQWLELKAAELRELEEEQGGGTRPT